jgi:hypothetical protein
VIESSEEVMSRHILYINASTEEMPFIYIPSLIAPRSLSQIIQDRGPSEVEYKVTP